MIAEAKYIIDAARARGVVLRLLGGLAVRLHCEALDFCERDYGDIDLVGRKRDAKRISRLFADLGYEEFLHVRQATGSRQFQFARECRHKDEWARFRPHEGGDHIDVFLDTFKMDHEIDLGDRLLLDEYTIPVSDVLLTKLQIARLTEKDERDVFTMLYDLELGVSDEPGVINVPYIARRCARDWGLFYDVLLNLRRLRDRINQYAVPPHRRAPVVSSLQRLAEAIHAEPKSAPWRLRARIGTRRPWHETIEEQD